MHIISPTTLTFDIATQTLNQYSGPNSASSYFYVVVVSRQIWDWNSRICVRSTRFLRTTRARVDLDGRQCGSSLNVKTGGEAYLVKARLAVPTMPARPVGVDRLKELARAIRRTRFAGSIGVRVTRHRGSYHSGLTVLSERGGFSCEPVVLKWSASLSNQGRQGVLRNRETTGRAKTHQAPRRQNER